MNLKNIAGPEQAHSPAASDVVHNLLDPLKLRPAERRVAVRICAQWVTLDDILNAAAEPREPIGVLLVKAAHRPGTTGRGLAEQHRSGEKLGEVLIRNEWLTEPELAAVLAFQ